MKTINTYFVGCLSFDVKFGFGMPDEGLTTAGIFGSTDVGFGSTGGSTSFAFTTKWLSPEVVSSSTFVLTGLEGIQLCPADAYSFESLGKERGRPNLAAVVKFGRLLG